jgi:hypothetical protein
MLHELIDWQDPQCLYCQASCDTELRGLHPNYNVNTYTCRGCRETFEIHWGGFVDVEEIAVFSFTCRDLMVCHQYGHGFAIDNHSLLWDGSRSPKSTNVQHCIPPFDVDFSDKDKLYRKLQTYLVFS